MHLNVSHAAVTPSSAPSSFVATNEWIAEWKAKLPLVCINRLIEVLLPLVESKVANDVNTTATVTSSSDELLDLGDILDFIKGQTLVGLLPLPHQIVIRAYQPNTYTNLWFTSHMWGVVFTRIQTLPVIDLKKIKLVIIGISAGSNNNNNHAAGSQH